MPLTTLTQRTIAAARRDGATVLTRREWGSTQGKLYAARRRERPVRVLRADTVVQHITVTQPTDDFRADCRAIERIGMERFGAGVSYNWLVNMRTGTIAAGMPLDAKGTHTVNDKGRAGYSYDQNHAARAIAVVGMPGTPLSPDAERALAILLRAMRKVGATTESPDYLPHSFFAAKDCPCDPTRNAMPRILELSRKD